MNSSWRAAQIPSKGNGLPKEFIAKYGLIAGPDSIGPFQEPCKDHLLRLIAVKKRHLAMGKINR